MVFALATTARQRWLNIRRSFAVSSVSQADPVPENCAERLRFREQHRHEYLPELLQSHLRHLSFC